MQKLVSKPRMQSDTKSFRLLYVINWRYCPMAVLLLPLLRKSCRHLFFFFFNQETKTEFYSATEIGNKVLVFYNSYYM